MGGFKSDVLLDLRTINRIMAEHDELDGTRGMVRWLGETVGGPLTGEVID